MIISVPCVFNCSNRYRYDKNVIFCLLCIFSGLLLTSRVPLELEPPSDYHASSKATQSSFVTSPQSQINPQAGIHFKSTSKRNRPMFSINSFHSPIVYAVTIKY